MANDDYGNGNGARRPFRFDWTLNFGHLLILATLLAGGFVAWSDAKNQINAVDDRTKDYQVTRDLARASNARLDAMQSIVQSVGVNNDGMRGDIGKIREDVAGIKATLAARP